MSLFNSEQDMQRWMSNRFQQGEDLAEMTINYTEYKLISNWKHSMYCFQLLNFKIHISFIKNQDFKNRINLSV